MTVLNSFAEIIGVFLLTVAAKHLESTEYHGPLNLMINCIYLHLDNLTTGI